MKKEKINVTRQETILKKVTLIFKIAAIVTTVIFPVLMGILTGAGWIYNIDSYGDTFKTYGIVMIASAVILVVSLVLCWLKMNIAAVITAIFGFIPYMITLFRANSFFDDNGYTVSGSFQPVSEMYTNRNLPTIAPFLLIVASALLQFFSYESALKRKKRREEKEKRENMPAPKILED